MSSNNVVNPGLVNVADQADGLVVVDQAVTTSPSTNAGPTEQGLTYADGEVSVEQPVTVTPPMTAQRTVEGGTYSPLTPSVVNTTENNVVNQTYGTGTPLNVFA